MIGTYIGSGIRLKESIVPLTRFVKIAKKVKKPSNELMSWNETDKIAKYLSILPILIFI